MGLKINFLDLTIFSPEWATFILCLEDYRRKLRIPIESKAMMVLVGVSSDVGDYYLGDFPDRPEIHSLFEAYKDDLVETGSDILLELGLEP